MAPFSNKLPAPTDSEKDALIAALALIDPERKGVNPGDLRMFYPGVGWDVIHQRLYALVDEGRLKRKMRAPAGGKIPLEYFSIEDNPPVLTPTPPAAPVE